MSVTSEAQNYIGECVRRSAHPDKALLSVALGLPVNSHALSRFINAAICEYVLSVPSPTGDFTSRTQSLRALTAKPYKPRKRSES